MQSATQNVKPGQVISAGIQWNPSPKTYTQWIAVDGGKHISTTVAPKDQHGETFVDAYFVVEHQ